MKKGDIRYTYKRKVMVIEPAGNGAGAIVQEIYIEDGKEFPAGPTFFAKQLKDSVVLPMTWEGRQIKAEQDRYEQSKGTLESVQRDIEIQVKANTEHLRDLGRIAKLDNLDALRRVMDFLAGDIRYVAILDGYHGYEITSFVDAITNIDSWHCKRYEGLKLLTLTGGRSNGKKTLNWNLNEYSDGSGSNTIVIPCKTKKEAVAVIQEYIDAQIAEGNTIQLDSAIALGCHVPAQYIQDRLADAQKRLRAYAKKKDDDRASQIAKYEKDIKRLEGLL